MKPSKLKSALVIGSGGREHALLWKLMQSNEVSKVYISPGNGGTAKHNVSIRADNIEGLCNFAKNNDCFTLVGPEVPLALGIVDHFRREGLGIFGPTSGQAMLETSKSYAKKFMVENGIPTADFGTFQDSQKAIDFAQRFGGRVAVKADGLAGGKGVFVCGSIEEAQETIRKILDQRTFGKSGERIVVEQRLEGSECSLMTICDGKTSIPFGTARDHKRALDGGFGPNTGGMGAFSPADNLNSSEVDEIIEKIASPTVRASGFVGFLYLGLMLTTDGPRVLEFNVRLGDPETQVILPRLKTDLFKLVSDYESGYLNECKWNDNKCNTVVMCSEGYPQDPHLGERIFGLEEAQKIEGVNLFHSGTVLRDGTHYTSGGRVLSVTGSGKTMTEAIKRSYSAVSLISWKGEHHRTDIGRTISC